MPTVHEPNQPIPLTKTDIIEIDGESTNVPVHVMLRLFPYPTIVIEAEELPNKVLQKEHFKISLRNGAYLEAMLLSFNLGTGKGALSPARQPADVIDKGLPLRSVQLSILNFPTFYGREDVWNDDKGHSTRIPHARLETPEWCVEITGVPNIHDVVSTLKQDGGYGFTYDVVITRSDGADFSVEKVGTLLTALRTFLSFARGASCSLALVEGLDQNGQQSWLRWGSHHVEPWKSINSWFRVLHGSDTLTELFPEFWRLFESGEEQRYAVLRAVDWYSQSNISPPYIGVILTVAALERLAYQVLGRPRKGKERTGSFIKKALENSQVPVDLPESYEELLKVHEWLDGSHAVVAIRNHLVHPNQTFDTVSDYAIPEAWNLGQWYIEMMLLRMLEYQGSYVNRLASWREHEWAFLTVPWAKEP